MRRVPTWVRLMVVLSLLAPVSLAGDLDAFEKDATRDRRDKSSTHSHTFDDDDDDHHHSFFDDDDDHEWFFAEFIMHLIGLPMVYGGGSSLARVSPNSNFDSGFEVDLREAGDPLIPMLRVDVDVQDPGNNLDAYNIRGSAGYGPIGIEVAVDHFEEDDTDDTLKLIGWHILYRMSYGSQVEIDMGFGSLTVDGDDSNSGFSFSLPVTVYPREHIGVEFNPAWASINGTTVRRYELAVYLSRDYVALKGGYRWTESPNESLDGPFVGLSFRY